MSGLFSGNIAFAMAQSSSTSNEDGGSAVVFILLVLVWAGAAVYFVRQRRDFDITAQTAASPEDVIAQAIRNYSSKGFTVTSNTGSTATFHKNLRAGCLPAILWFLLGIIPGFIYLVIGGRDLTSTVSARSIGAGSTSVQISGNARGFGAMAPVQQLVNSLPPVVGGHM